MRLTQKRAGKNKFLLQETKLENLREEQLKDASRKARDIPRKFIVPVHFLQQQEIDGAYQFIQPKLANSEPA